MVKPCPCTSVYYRPYFNCFSIFLMSFHLPLIIGLTILNSLNSTFGTVLGEILFITFFLTLIYIFYVFRKRGKYGTQVAHYYSLLLSIMASSCAIAIIIFMFVVLALGTHSIDGFEKINPTVFYIVYFVVILPASVYHAYLCYLYFLVIKTEQKWDYCGKRKRGNQRRVVEKDYRENLV